MHHVKIESSGTECVRFYNLTIDDKRYRFVEYYDDDFQHVYDCALYDFDTNVAIGDMNLIDAVTVHLDNPHY